MEYTALVVAAGSGSRVGLGYNKMLYKLQNGNTILEETLQVFQQDARCHQIVVVASAQDMETFHEVCDEKKYMYSRRWNNSSGIRMEWAAESKLLTCLDS